jgi:hypothetical protein
MARPTHIRRITNGTPIMRYREITEDEPVKPLTPKQARRRAARQQKAQIQLANTQATTAIKINAAKQKLSKI